MPSFRRRSTSESRFAAFAVCLPSVCISCCQSSGFALHSRHGLWIRRVSILLVLVFFHFVSGPYGGAHTPPKKNVLILNQVGLSHVLTNMIAQELIAGIPNTPGRYVEFYSESFDMLSFPKTLTPSELQETLVKQYGKQKFDAVVAVGPDTIKFLEENADSIFPSVPVVICGSSADQAGVPELSPNFTGTWQQPDPKKTVGVALSLFPDTKHIFVVGGTSDFDRSLMSSTRNSLSSFITSADITYLTDTPMGELLKQLQNLPVHSAVLYVSFFQDADGQRFMNATQALPMIASAANSPIFGMSDTYLGHGIVGGDLVSFHEQGKVTARIVSNLLDGKQAEEIPITTLPSLYMFDWNELNRWHIRESSLPPDSVVVFRVPTLWERTRWMWTGAFLVITGLSLLSTYLHRSRKQLELAKERQRNLSGMLITATERERSRVAAEIHDDFSQRVAVIALKLENVAEIVAPFSNEADRQLHEVLNSTSELGADLHTLSHQLHSSTLESLGLVPAVGALCKEFTSQQGIEVHFTFDHTPGPVHPDVGLCLFRIVQEGLRNLKKHSGAQHASVDLRVDGQKLFVRVTDQGSGFDMKELAHNSGLGVRAMEERVRLLGGEFTIEAAPGEGTTVEAWVPLTPNQLRS